SASNRWRDSKPAQEHESGKHSIVESRKHKDTESPSTITPTIGGRTEVSAHHQSPPKERSTGTSTLRGCRRVGGTNSGTDGGRGRPPSDRKVLERGVGHS